MFRKIDLLTTCETLGVVRAKGREKRHRRQPQGKTSAKKMSGGMRLDTAAGRARRLDQVKESGLTMTAGDKGKRNQSVEVVAADVRRAHDAAEVRLC